MMRQRRTEATPRFGYDRQGPLAYGQLGPRCGWIVDPRSDVSNRLVKRDGVHPRPKFDEQDFKRRDAELDRAHAARSAKEGPTTRDDAWVDAFVSRGRPRLCRRIQWTELIAIRRRRI